MKKFPRSTEALYRLGTQECYCAAGFPFLIEGFEQKS
jgi:hypothetical protein